MNILDQIAASTKKRVEQSKRICPIDKMKEMAGNRKFGETFSFEKALSKPEISFICEIKKASPSKGIIAEHFPYVDIAKEYESAGADCMSVLTEPEYFKGDIRYLEEIREAVKTPLLRKDFTVDEYMIYEAAAVGANAVLLICSLLSESQLADWIELSGSLGLSALVEAHDEREIEMAIDAGAKIIGVNNRNLKTFEVDVTNCLKLREKIPADILFVAESGIRTHDDIVALKAGGVNGVLIGETLMRSDDKRATLRRLRGEM